MSGCTVREVFFYTPEPRITSVDDIYALQHVYSFCTMGKQTVNQQYFGCWDLKQEAGDVQM